MSTELNHADILKFTKSVKYIIECKSNKKRDATSLSSIVRRDMSQSDCIKLGHAVENYARELLIFYGTFKDIKEKNKKGIKEKDMLFEKENTINYTEVKVNGNLDTEKAPATLSKMSTIKRELEHSGKEVNAYLLCCRYINRESMPKEIIKKYGTIVIGLNEWLENHQIKYKFTEESHIELINKIADECFSSS